MDFWSAARQARVLAFDTETTGLDIRHDQLLGFSLAFEEAGHVRSAYIKYTDATHDKLLEVLATGHKLVMHNAIFDLNVLDSIGIHIWPHRVIDTMVAAHLLNENEQVGLKYLGEVILGKTMTELGILIREYGSIEGIPPARMAQYAALDAECTLRLWFNFEPRLREEGLYDLFFDVEMPNVHIIAGMERRGVRFDIEAAKKAGAEVQKQRDELLGEIEAIIEDCGYQETKEQVRKEPVTEIVTMPNGKTKKMRTGYNEIVTEVPIPFNINSVQMLSRLLFDHFGLKPVNNERNVRKETLSVLADKHPQLRILTALLEYRKLAKLLSTYYKPLVEKAEENDGILHTHFNPCGTVTGRSSSSEPNLQNAPRQKSFRSLFVARDGYKLLVADLSQAELRVVAHESQDPMLLKAYREKIDVHQQTADGLHIERYVAKTLNFALLYGMGAKTLQSKLWTEAKVKVTVEEAEDIKSRWYKLYAGITPWQESVKTKAREQGYVTNMFGRKRRLPDINSDDFSLRSYAEREAVNFMIQSAVAHIIKKAKIAFMYEVQENHPDVHLLLEVHDELVAEASDECAEFWGKTLELCMTNASDLCVPIPGEVGVGVDWGSAKK